MPWSLARTRSTSRGFVEFVRGVHRRFSLCNPARRVRDGGAFLWGIRKFWQTQARTCSLPASRPGDRAFRASPRPFLRAASTWDHEGGPCPRRRPLHLGEIAPTSSLALPKGEDEAAGGGLLASLVDEPDPHTLAGEVGPWRD